MAALATCLRWGKFARRHRLKVGIAVEALANIGVAVETNSAADELRRLRKAGRRRRERQQESKNS
jgi:hypothetical protein